MKHFFIAASSVITDLAVLCKRLLGRWAQWLAVIFSALILLGASIVYWILLSNFLFHTVDYVHSVIVHDNSTAGNSTDTDSTSHNIFKHKTSISCLQN